MTVTRTGTPNTDVIIAHKTYAGLTWETWKIWGRDGHDSLQGGNDNDYLYGEAGNDTLHGLDDHDYLDGGIGADTMYGGKGNDHYIVDNNVFERVIEYTNEGYDTVTNSLYSYTLPSNVEKLVMAGWTYQGIGNELNNYLYGNNYANRFLGEGGNDKLEGIGGNDFLDGGIGDDTLLGGSGHDHLYGDSYNDVLQGGTGDDKYHLSTDSTRIKITELSQQGTDTIYIYTDYASQPRHHYTPMPNNVENLVLMETLTTSFSYGGNNGNNRLTGNSRGNTFYGSDGNDTLIGLDGNDYLTGNSGKDTLIGGNGRDTLLGVHMTYTNDTDVLQGGPDADIFQLGYHLSNFYQQGTGFAIIDDFSRSEGDKIKVMGNASYQLRAIPIEGVGTHAQDTAIFSNNHLMGVVKDNINVADSVDFLYAF